MRNADKLLAARPHEGVHWRRLFFSPGLTVQMLWGRPTGDEIAALLAQRGEEHEGQDRRILLDCSRVADMTLSTAYRLREFLNPRQGGRTARAGRRALVCFAEAEPYLAGTPSVANPESRAFSDFEVALDWLSPSLCPERRAEILARSAELAFAPSLASRLRQLLVREMVDQIDVAFAAKMLRCSSRSLQRALSQQGTTFQLELNQARIARAKRELRTGVSVTSLAFELGFQNVQSFIRAFKQGTGVTPGAWRRSDSGARPEGDSDLEP